MPGTVTAVLFEVSVTTTPPTGAAPESVMMQVLEPDVVNVAGAQLTALMVIAGGADGLTGVTWIALPLLSAPNIEPIVTPDGAPGTVTIATTPSGIDPLLIP